MDRTQFIVKIEFSDGDTFDLGGGDEVFVTPGEGKLSAEINDDRLNLIRLLRDAEIEACE